MSVGTVIFAAWAMSDIPQLVLAGLITLIYAGPALFLVGTFTLCIHIRKARNVGVPHGRPTIIAAVILLLNWPIGLAYSATGYHMMTGRFVTIENDYVEHARGIVLTDPRNTKFPVADLAPGLEFSSCFDFDGEGQVEFSLAVNDKIHDGVILSYISGSFGGKGRILITEDGDVEATESHDSIPFREFVRFCLL